LKLLFDADLSFRLAQSLRDVFPDALHVRDLGLGAADDDAIWTYARVHGMTIVTKE